MLYIYMLYGLIARSAYTGSSLVGLTGITKPF